MDCLFLCTIQSTGTWWAINALRKHPYIGGLSYWKNVMAHKNGWVLRGPSTGNPHGEAIAPRGQFTLLFAHYRPVPPYFDRWYPQGEMEHMISVVPTFAPLRDPLICLIRAWHREPPHYPYDNLIDEWIHVARRDDTLGMKFWRMEPFDRQGFLQTLLDIGLTANPRWEQQLTPKVRVNTTPGECILRTYYENGNTAAIERSLPQPWRRLRESEPVLRPFLEKHGFRDLLWWS